jgi:hypothetical protein
VTKKDVQLAMSIAIDSNIDLSGVDDSIFNGFGLPGFNPVSVTLRQVAKLIRWQAIMFNGEFDAYMYNEIVSIGRKKFIVCN